MSQDSFQKVTSQSWFSRIIESIKGIIVGILLFLIAFPVLFWNEGRAVKTARSLEEGAASVVSIVPDKIDPGYDGKLVHLTGEARTDEQLKDPTFTFTVNGVALRRQVEMYQWEEHKRSETRKKLGGGTETVTTYDYEKTWSNRVIDSSRFEKPEGHRNPSKMKYDGHETRATKVTVGAFDLSAGLIKQMNDFQPFPVTKEIFDKLPDDIRRQAQLEGGSLYFGSNPSSPQIGDTRVSFAVVSPGTISLVAQQTGKTFQPYKTKNDRSLEILYAGVHSAESMFEAEMAKNSALTWVLRFAGFLMMFIGLSMVFRPLSVVADVIPFIGSFVGLGTSLAAGGISIVMSLFTIAIGWIFYRPLLGIALLMVAGAVIVGLVTLIRKKGQRGT